LTKADMLDGKSLNKIAKAVEKVSGSRPFPVSAPLEEGIGPLLDAVTQQLGSAARDAREEAEGDRPWSPL